MRNEKNKSLKLNLQLWIGGLSFSYAVTILSSKGFCLKLKISINSELIKFSILDKLQTDPGMVLGFLFSFLIPHRVPRY